MDWLTMLGLENLISPERLLALVRSVLTLLIGLFIARLVARGVAGLVRKQAGDQQTMLAKRLTFYTVAALVIVSALGQLGINLGVLLGAAGILTVAIGFASQTSASNLVSGLFLMAERPFVVGDWIKIDDVYGIVVSIDLLAVKIRLFDNSLVRIPNESIIKNRLTNITHYPIHRIDTKVGVAYKENMARVRELLFELADRNPLVLDNPPPQFLFDGYGDSALEFRFCVWVAKDNIVDVRNAIRLDIKELFDRQGIEIPFPHRTLYTGSVTEPFPIRLVETGLENELDSSGRYDGPTNGE
jgi:small-conductance mechanosensitive channel